jgi:integrase
MGAPRKSSMRSSSSELKRMGCAQAGPHSFLHSSFGRDAYSSSSAGSLLIQAGVRPKDVQAILRHSKVSTTMDLYVHSYDDDLRAAVGTLEVVTG